MLKCKSCGGALDLTMASCPSCGADVPMGRITGILGLVCRHCDAYNEPGAKTCISCGKPLGSAPEDAAEASAPSTAPAPAASASPVTASLPRPGAPHIRSLGGPPAAAPALCPACGAPTSGSPFCPACGRSLRATGAAPGAAGAPAGTAMFVAPTPAPRRARLHVERGEASAGAVFQIAAEEVQAGRSQGQVIFPSDPCLAPHHATFLQRGGALAVRDEGAAGGIFLRIPQGQSLPLKPGSLFAVGDRLLRFAGSVPAPPPPPPDGTMRLGAPRPEGPAVLVEEWLEGGVGGRVYLRTGPSITVGRAGCAVNLGEDGYLSQAHAEIVVEPDGSASLRDLGSSNGTFLRVAPGSEAPLKNGDELRMGREVLRVEVA